MRAEYYQLPLLSPRPLRGIFFRSVPQSRVCLFSYRLVYTYSLFRFLVVKTPSSPLSSHFLWPSPDSIRLDTFAYLQFDY